MASRTFLFLVLLLVCCSCCSKVLYKSLLSRKLSSVRAWPQYRIITKDVSIPSTCMLSCRGGFSYKEINTYCSAIVGNVVDPTIGGGLLSGALHAITGPDHLAAILPASFGHAGWFGLRVGCVWGLGHGLSAISLGLAVFFLKDSISNQFQFMNRYAIVAETAIGISLLVIGLLGTKECLTNAADHLHDGQHRHHHHHSQEPVNAAVTTTRALRTAYRKSVFLNGLLHGCSWDGAPSIAPAMTMSSWKGATLFLLAYCIGTMVAMSVTAASLGELSRRLGSVAEDPDLPRKLSLVSSVLATCIGVYWLGKVVFKHGI